MHYVFLTGYVGADAEIRQYGQDTATNFRIAVNERWTDSYNVPKERTTWYSCTAWNVTYGASIRQGRRMFVMGIPQERKPFQRRDNTWDVSNDVRVMFAEFQDANPAPQQNNQMGQVPANAQFSGQNSQTQVDQYRMNQQQEAAAAAAAMMGAAVVGLAASQQQVQFPNQAPGNGLPSVDLPPTITNPMIATEAMQGDDLPY